jgi:hypothetical protein
MGIMIPPDKKMAQLILNQKEIGAQSYSMGGMAQTNDSVDPVCEEYASDMMKMIQGNDVKGLAKLLESMGSYLYDKAELSDREAETNTSIEIG